MSEAVVTAPTPNAPAPEANQSATTPTTPAQPIATPPAAAPETIGDPAPAAPVADSGSADAHTYNPTGDAALDVALGFVGKLGLGPTHPAIIDAAEGKFEKLEATLGALGDKAAGWEQYVALAKDAYTRTEATQTQTQQAITSAIHEVAGSAEQWDAVKKWAGANAEPAEKEAINAMLTAGPIQARAAAMLLGDLYRNAGGTVVIPANPTDPNAGNGGPTGNGALSPAEYGKAVRDLRAQLGSRFDSSPEYQALRARRAAFRG